MKKLAVIVMIGVFFSADVLAQQKQDDGEKSRKELRKEKRESRKKLYDLKKQVGVDLLEKRDFVLKPTLLANRRGDRTPVSSDVNFISIQGEYVTVQYGLVGRNGVNGLGGQTFTGKIIDFKTFDQGEGKAYNALVSFNSPFLGNPMIVNISIRGSQAEARITHRGNFLRFEGDYLALSQTSLWQQAIINSVD